VFRLDIRKKQSSTKKWLISLGSFLGFLILICFGALKYFHETSLLPLASEENDGSHYNQIPITKWTASQYPCLTIQIGDKVISSYIDLGFRGYFSLNRSVLEQIEEKTLLGSQKMHGFQGHTYRNSVFSIPEIRINGIPFYSNEVQEEAQDFYENATFVKDGSEPSPPEPGSIGWKVFRSTNLLMDFRNQKIALCDSVSTLKKQGYSIETFVATPLLIERGLIEVALNTTNGPLRCMLDTGCTWNVINTKNSQNKTMDELVWDPENFYEMTSLQINEMELGPVSFRRLPIELPIHIEAILGMEFLSQCTVFLDFSKNLAYFSRFRVPYGQAS
jgi:hypothetical protein